MWGPSRIQFWGRLSSRHSGSHWHARVQTESFDRNFESLCHSCCQTLPGGVSHRVFNASVLPWHRDSGMVALWWPCRAARGGLQVRLRFAAWAARKRAISGPVAPWRGKVVTGSDSGKARRLSRYFAAATDGPAGGRGFAAWQGAAGRAGAGRLWRYCAVDGPGPGPRVKARRLWRNIYSQCAAESQCWRARNLGSRPINLPLQVQFAKPPAGDQTEAHTARVPPPPVR